MRRSLLASVALILVASWGAPLAEGHGAAQTTVLHFFFDTVNAHWDGTDLNGAPLPAPYDGAIPLLSEDQHATGAKIWMNHTNDVPVDDDQYHRTFNESWRYKLPGGDIIVKVAYGAQDNNDPVWEWVGITSGTITGGTGRYEGVAGTINMRARGEADGSWTCRCTLTLTK